MKTPTPAPYFPRIIAIFIDTFMILFPVTIVLIVLFGYNELKESKPFLAGALQMGIYGSIVAFMWVKKGYTPGKKVMRLLVLDDTTHKTISGAQAIYRFLFYFVSMVTIIGLLIPLVRKDNKALHDILANTTVVRI